MEVFLIFPKSKQAQQELGQELAKFQSEQALKSIQKLPCSTEQKLEQAILSPKKLRRCKVCGTGILARSGRAKYCPACAKDVHRQQKAKFARKRRSGVDNSGSKSP